MMRISQSNYCRCRSSVPPGNPSGETKRGTFDPRTPLRRRLLQTIVKQSRQSPPSPGRGPPPGPRPGVAPARPTTGVTSAVLRPTGGGLPPHRANRDGRRARFFRLGRGRLQRPRLKKTARRSPIAPPTQSISAAATPDPNRHCRRPPAAALLDPPEPRRRGNPLEQSQPTRRS